MVLRPLQPALWLLCALLLSSQSLVFRAVLPQVLAQSTSTRLPPLNVGYWNSFLYTSAFDNVTFDYNSAVPLPQP